MTSGIDIKRSLAIEIPIEPVPFSRPRFNSRTGAVFNAGPYDRFKKDVRRIVPIQTRLYDKPLRVTMQFILKRPKSPTFKDHAATKPDLDNFIKALGDALEGVIWDNDSRICEYGDGTGKFYAIGGLPRIRLMVQEL